jgi:alkanesulfonate monooxygenase SsuD/methylene tetrahydromethanopterin reductase-like flavin-dependent oxidoreductase (luciferase family)
VPQPPIVVGAQSPAGVELAARIGDGWTVPASDLARLLPRYLDALAGAGRPRDEQQILAAFDLPTGATLAGSPWTRDPAAEAERWRAAGADGVIVGAASTGDVDLLVDVATRR